MRVFTCAALAIFALFAAHSEATGDDEATRSEANAIDPMFADEGITNLHVAAYLGKQAQFDFCKRVRAYVEAKADLDKESYNGNTALIWAASGAGDSDVVEMLIKAGADLDRTDIFGWTALMVATREGYADVVRVLLEAGADRLLESNKGNTALSIAERYNNCPGCLRLLRPPKTFGGLLLEYIPIFGDSRTPLMITSLESVTSESSEPTSEPAEPATEPAESNESSKVDIQNSRPPNSQFERDALPPMASLKLSRAEL